MYIKESRENNKIIGNYGISFLDDYLGGIRKSDMVLIGADTGAGKSTLAYQIAFNNSLENKVHLFALEADIHEPYIKQAYTFIADQYFNKRKIYKHLDMSYRNFLLGKIDEKYFEPELTQYMDKFYRLTVHYKEKEFTINTLLEKFAQVAEHCDMIILDHIDYFDLISGMENQEVTEILKELRSIGIDYNIPIIILSHIRKPLTRGDLLPDKEDFMGTSNKTKITKTSILISPDYENYDFYSGRFGTYIQIPKDRAYGKTNLVARCIFNRNKNTYEKEYELHKIKMGVPEDKIITVDELPPWAMNAKEAM